MMQLTWTPDQQVLGLWDAMGPELARAGYPPSSVLLRLGIARSIPSRARENDPGLNWPSGAAGGAERRGQEELILGVGGPFPRQQAGPGQQQPREPSTGRIRGSGPEGRRGRGRRPGEAPREGSGGGEGPRTGAMPSKFAGVAGERRPLPAAPALPLGASAALRGRGWILALYSALLALVASHYVAFHAHRWLGLEGNGGQRGRSATARGACSGGSGVLPPGPDGTCPDPALLHHMLSTWTRDFHLDHARIPPPGQDWPSANASAVEEEGGRTLAVVPHPPHLEDCTRQATAIEDWERRGHGGEEPPWAQDKKHPTPPWVQGSDTENLAGTRKVQMRIWLHQHPAECSEKRLLVVSWAKVQEGVAAAVHLMGLALNMAMAANRVLVPLNGSFALARHSACEDLGLWGDWGCYWHAVTSAQCRAEAAKLLAESKVPAGRDDPFVRFAMLGLNGSALNAPVTKVLLSANRLVVIRRTNGVRDYVLDEGEPQHRIKGETWWGAPWRDRPSSFELLPSPREEGVVDGTGDGIKELDEALQLRWWMAQASRYFLRWPKPYMCHLLNRMRHASYGDQVAASLLQILERNRASHSKPAEFFRVGPTSLEQGLWAENPVAQPYIPRPILSLQAGYTDRGLEDAGDEGDASAYLRAAYRMRQHVPNLRTAWVTTELMSMLVELQSGADAGAWDLLFSRSIRRQSRMTKDAAWHMDLENGVEASAADALANIVIASECDHFVGVLGSHWGHLIDGLRQTNGHYRGGLVTLNYTSVEEIFYG